MSINKQIPPISAPVTTDQGNMQPMWWQWFYNFAAQALTTVGGVAGFIVSTPSGLLTRTITPGSNKVSVTNGNGVSGNPIIDVNQANLSIANTQLTGATLSTGASVSGSNTGDQTITLTGDVTGTGTGSFAATVGSIGGKAVSLSNSLTTSGNFAQTFTFTGTTNVTFPTSGTLATVGGSAISAIHVQVLTGSGTYTPTANASLIWARGVAGGGGGGGCTTSTNQSGTGGGGGAGAYGEYIGIAESLAYSVGTGGAGGTAGNDGTTGNATTLGTAGAKLNLGGGGGGHHENNNNTSKCAGGTGGTATTGTFKVNGGDGLASWAYNVIFGIGGQGAPSPFGGGGAAAASGGVGVNGSAATAYGAGGGGGVIGSSTSSSATGGAGANGTIIIIEYGS